MTDTGSLLYNITTEYVKVDMKNNLQLFDTSGYLSGHSCFIADNINNCIARHINPLVPSLIGG